MKKFLSLVLALVMTMSLVTVGAGAAFDDADDITYVEAVEVMKAVGVIDGYPDGSFKPENTLTRGAAAKIICNMILGPTTAAALTADTAPFADVPVTDTYAGYIAYCAKEGIVSGLGDGSFKPYATLTTNAFLKMLLGALGYDPAIEGYVGDNWGVNVSKQALGIGLNAGKVDALNGGAAITREEACLYALNAMRATMVEYSSKTSVVVGGAEVVIAGSEAKNVAQTGYKNAGENNKETLQFAEMYFPKLAMTEVVGAYGRPSHKWVYKNKTVGTFASIAPAFEYTAATKQKTVYNDLGKDVVGYDWTVYVDGVEDPTVTKPAKASGNYEYTANGAVTEIYIDEDAQEVVLVEINNYLAKVTKVDDDANGDYVKLNVLSAAPESSAKFYTEGFAKNDFVVVTFDAGVVASVEAAEVVEGTVDVVRKWTDDNNKEYLKLDGEQYTYSSHLEGDVDTDAVYPTLDTKYALYLDANGFVLGFDCLEKTSHDYLYVLDSDVYMSKNEAEVILSDGTLATVVVKSAKNADGDALSCDNGALLGTDKAPEGPVYKYELSSGKYVLTEVANTNESGETSNIYNGKAYITTDGSTTYIVDEETVFVDVIEATAPVVYTGFEEVPSYEKASFWLIDDDADGVTDLVWIYKGVVYDVDAVYFYVADKTDFTSRNKTKTVADQVAYVDGEKTTVAIEYGERNTEIKAEGLYKVKKTNTAGVATEVELVATVAQLSAYDVKTLGTRSFYTEQNKKDGLPATQWVVDANTEYVVVDLVNATVDTGSFDDVAKNPASIELGDDLTYVYVVSAKEGVATLVYVVKTEPTTVAATWNTPAHATIKGYVNGVEVANGEKVLSGGTLTFKVSVEEGYQLKVNLGFMTTIGAGADQIISVYDGPMNTNKTYNFVEEVIPEEVVKVTFVNPTFEAIRVSFDGETFTIPAEQSKVWNNFPKAGEFWTSAIDTDGNPLTAVVTGATAFKFAGEYEVTAINGDVVVTFSAAI